MSNLGKNLYIPYFPFFSKQCFQNGIDVLTSMKTLTKCIETYIATLETRAMFLLCVSFEPFLITLQDCDFEENLLFVSKIPSFCKLVLLKSL